MQAADGSQVKTIERLVGVLDCFTHDRPAWSLAELSAHLHTPKSTLHRFLVGLEAHGLLRREDGDRRWRLGYHLVIWGHLAIESNTLRDLARPAMRQLADATGETVLLTIYDDGEVVCIDIYETAQPVGLRMSVGVRTPAHAGASSKALMAYLPAAEVARIRATRGLPQVCSNTITDPDALDAELAHIRELGYALSVEETDPGAWGVATPIRDWRDRVVAAIGIAGPTTRFSDEKLPELVGSCRAAAATVSAQLRRRQPPD